MPCSYSLAIFELDNYKSILIRYNGKLYAAKKIHSTLTDEVSPEEREAIKNNLIQECLCCSTIHHPNVVQFLGVYYPNKSDFPIMMMELMTCSLNSFIKKDQCNIGNKTKISILYDVSLGLSFLHGREPQIVHGDLSSNNVMLTSQLVAKIGDLGVAKVIRAGNKNTKVKLMQTPGMLDFMPPEILEENDVVYATAVDVFSFGCVALHVFSKYWPTPGPSKTRDDETNKSVVFTEAERRKKYLDMMISEDVVVLKDLVERCLSDSPNLRPIVEEISNSIMQLKV